MMIAQALRTFVGVFARRLWALPSLFRVHTSAQVRITDRPITCAISGNRDLSIDSSKGENMIEPYNVACIQTSIRQVRDPATRDETIRENLYRSISLMEYASIRFGQPKLVVLPEFYLTGADHLRRTIPEWAQVAVRIPGPETDALGKAAQEL